MKNKGTQFLAEAAVIGAIYVVLTVLFAPLSYGEVQVRFSEALTILPFSHLLQSRELFIGCIIANLFGGSNPGRHHLRKHCYPDRCGFHL